MPKISVIIPCYKVEEYVARCLDSLLNDSLADIEIIVINDESPDNTLKILREYAKKYKNITVMDQKNTGQAIARNKAVKKAKGEYLMFVDSDDFVVSGILEKMYNAAVKNKSDLVYSDYYEYYSKDDIRVYKNNIAINETPQKNALLANYAPWAKLYKMSYWKQNKFEFVPNRLMEDVAVIPIANVLAKNPVYIDEPLYYYNNENISSFRLGTYNKKLEDIFFISEFLYKEFEKRNLLKEFYEEIEFIYLDSFLKGGVFRFADFKEGLIHIPLLRCQLKEFFPNMLTNKYFKKNSNYLKLLTKLAYSFPPKLIYWLKKVKG